MDLDRTSSGTDIIRRMSENDSYLDSMGHASDLYSAWAKYIIKDKDNTVFPPGTAGAILEKIQDLKALRLLLEEKKFLISTVDYIPESYWNWLEMFRYNPEYISLSQDEEGHLKGFITGPWKEAMQWGSVIIAIIVQTRNELFGYVPDDDWEEELKRIIDHLIETGGVHIMEMSFRRRPYGWMEDRACEILYEYGGYFKNGGIYTGSSNRYQSFRLNTIPKGTVAHEWYLMHAAFFGIEYANLTSITDWRAIYGDNIGQICLPDTFTSRFFWATMPAILASLYLTARQDSGEPIQFTNDWMRFLRSPKIKIDPSLATGVYTNKLDEFEIRRIQRYVSRYMHTAYGAGELFGGNARFFKHSPGYTPANIVTKPIAFSFDECRTWQETAKISDDYGKTIGNSKIVEQYREVIANHPFLY